MRMRYIFLVLIVLVAGLGFGFKEHLFDASGTRLNIDVEVSDVTKTFSSVIHVYETHDHYLTRYIDGHNVCYKTGGGSLSCVETKIDVINVTSIDIEVFESYQLYKYHDKFFNIDCYKTKGGQMDCVQK